MVMHGVGKKTPGWTEAAGLPSRWGPGHYYEANFNSDASVAASFTNFLTRTGEWVASAKSLLQSVAQKHPRSAIDIVGHSWGSVVAAALLGGGTLFGRRYEPITEEALGSSVCRHLVTMGSPLCWKQLGRLLGVRVAQDKPAIVRGRWLNLYNSRDRLPMTLIPIGTRPVAVDGCENLEVSSATTHTGYWRSEEVAECLRTLC